MTKRHLRAIQPKSYTPKTSDGRPNKPSDNLLLGQPHPEQSNQVWAGDITHIPTSIGWLYFAGVIDLCSRKIVNWALAHSHQLKATIPDSTGNFRVRLSRSTCLGSGSNVSNYARSRALISRTARPGGRRVFHNSVLPVRLCFRSAGPSSCQAGGRSSLPALGLVDDVCCSCD